MADINNSDNNTLISGTSEADSIENSGSNVTINADAGNDSISSWTNSVTMDGGADDDSIINDGENVSISGGAGNDTIESFSAANNSTLSGGDGVDVMHNYGSNVTIDGGAGDDEIANFGDTDESFPYGLNVSINGGEGNDLIKNDGGTNLTIGGGAGDDQIYNASDSKNYYVYNAGDGNDTINNYSYSGGTFSDNYELQINSSSGWSSVESGNDIVVTVSDGSITLVDAAGSNVTITGDTTASEDSKEIYLTEYDDDYTNTLEGATIHALSGNDTLFNSQANVVIYGEGDNDSIDNHGLYSLIDGSAGNDTLYNYVGGAAEQGQEANYSTVLGSEGDDFIDNHGNHSYIDGGAGADTIWNPVGAWFDDEAEYSTLIGGAGDDSIDNHGNHVSIDGGAGNDTINNFSTATDSTITGGDGADVMHNYGSNVTIDGGAGDDEIANFGDTDESFPYGLNVSINGGEGNDLIKNDGGTNLTIGGGAGDDQIYNASDSKNYYVYNEGEGNDTINNYSYSGGTFSDNYELQINSSSGWSSVESGNDIVVKVSDGSITLVDAVGSNVTITGDTGDTVGGETSKEIYLTEYDDDYTNTLEGATIHALSGNDTLSNSQANVVLYGEGDNDSITNTGANITINAGAGDDTISLASSATENVIEYTDGDGNDTVYGYNDSHTLQINSSNGWSSVVSGNDIVVTVGEGFITLIDAADTTASGEGEKISYNGHTYQRIDSGMTWQEAKVYCENLGGHLVTITDADEQNFIENSILSSATKNNYWLGGHENDDGSWYWVTDETWDYANWGRDQPDGDGPALMMYNSEENSWPKGSWNDLLEDGTHEDQTFFGTDNFGLICEWEPSDAPTTDTVVVNPDNFSGLIRLAQWTFGFNPPDWLFSGNSISENA